jgi:hypothetical protein
MILIPIDIIDSIYIIDTIDTTTKPIDCISIILLLN